MNTFDSYDSYSSEKLLRSARDRYRLRAATRVAVTEAVAACLFLTAAVIVAAVTGPGLPSASALLATMIAYLVASRVWFPVASGGARPTQLVFVPMLFVLPLGLVPLLVAAYLQLGLLPEVLRRKAGATRVVARFADSFFSLGPVLVLLAFGVQHFSYREWPVYLLAFVAQVTVDFAAGFARGWFAEGIRPSKQPQMDYVLVTDACLSCAGLLIAAAVAPAPWALLLAIPLIALFWLFARDRQRMTDSLLQLSETCDGMAHLLGDVTEADDAYTGMHSRDVVHMSLVVADRLGLDEDTKRIVEYGALLHDVGKIHVPNEIIRKPGKLDESEWMVMKQHTIIGEEMLNPLGGTLSTAAGVVRASHERFDGTGYPDGLAGEQIPIAARIVSTCDAFSAMTTTRSYRPAMALGDAISELRRCSGSALRSGRGRRAIAVIGQEAESLAGRPDCDVTHGTDLHLVAGEDVGARPDEQTSARAA